jgi:hypothetical protein
MAIINGGTILDFERYKSIPYISSIGAAQLRRKYSEMPSGT